MPERSLRIVRPAVLPRFEPRDGLRPQRREAQIVSCTPLGEGVIEFGLYASGEAEFLPGQYALLELPGLARPRAYSLANAPNRAGVWQFVMREAPGGAASRRWFDAGQRPQRLWLEGPFGEGHLRAESPRDVLCVAVDAGLARARSLLIGAALQGSRERGLGLLYAGSRAGDRVAAGSLAHDPLIGARAQLHLPDLARPAELADALAAWCARVPDPLAVDYYVSAPAVLAQTLERLLHRRFRLPPRQVHVEPLDAQA